MWNWRRNSLEGRKQEVMQRNFSNPLLYVFRENMLLPLRNCESHCCVSRATWKSQFEKLILCRWEPQAIIRTSSLPSLWGPGEAEINMASPHTSRNWTMWKSFLKRSAKPEEGIKGDCVHTFLFVVVVFLQVFSKPSAAICCGLNCELS